MVAGITVCGYGERDSGAKAKAMTYAEAVADLERRDRQSRRHSCDLLFWQRNSVLSIEYFQTQL